MDKKKTAKTNRHFSRSKARDYVYQLIFSSLFTGELDEERMTAIAEDGELTDEDIDYVRHTYELSVANRSMIEEMIERHADGYTLHRIFKPDLAVLILAVTEMRYSDVPDVVAINEALNVIQNYSTAKSKRFVNGVLAGVYKELNECN